LLQPRTNRSKSHRNGTKPFAHHDAALLEKILTPSWVDIPSPPDAPHGPEAAKALMAILVGAFPDFDIQVEDIIQDGNKVVVRSTSQARSSRLLLAYPQLGDP